MPVLFQDMVEEEPDVGMAIRGGRGPATDILSVDEVSRSSSSAMRSGVLLKYSTSMRMERE